MQNYGLFRNCQTILQNILPFSFVPSCNCCTTAVYAGLFSWSCISPRLFFTLLYILIAEPCRHTSATSRAQECQQTSAGVPARGHRYASARDNDGHLAGQQASARCLRSRHSKKTELATQNIQTFHYLCRQNVRNQPLRSPKATRRSLPPDASCHPKRPRKRRGRTGRDTACGRHTKEFSKERPYTKTKTNDRKADCT